MNFKNDILELIDLKQEIKNLQTQLQNRTYCYDTIKKDEKLFKSQTGLDPDSYEILYNFLGPGENCNNIKMYDSALKTEDVNNVQLTWSPAKGGFPTGLSSPSLLA